MKGQDYIQLTLFQEDFPVNHFLTPGSAEARKMTVTSGRKWLGLSRNCGPLGLLEKMLLESSIWHSTRCYLTWRAKDTPHGHFLYQLAASTPHTSDTGPQSWPTPTASDSFTGQMRSSQQKEGSRHSLNLTDAVKLWPTPKASSVRGDCPSERKRKSPDLASAVKMFPTPTAQDAKKLYFPGITDTEAFADWGIDERTVCNTAGQRLPDWSGRTMDGQEKEQESERPDCRRGEPDGGRQWAVEPNVGRVAHGIPNRVDRIKCLGNAVVPQQFYPIFRAISEIELGTKTRI